MSKPTPTPAPLPVLLAASVPDEVIGTPEAQRIYDYVGAVVAALFDADLSLVFGGHPTITALVHQAVRARGGARPSIDLFQLERFRDAAPPEALDGAVFARVHWVGDPTLPIDADLANLREPMVTLAQAAIFIGGKTAGYQGDKPGIRDEFERFRAHHPKGPVYLVGGAGGEAARMVAESDGRDWEHNGLRGEARAVLHASRDEHIVAAVMARDLQRLRQG